VAGDRSIEIQWLGHATVLVEDRARILTDPVLTNNVAHLHRRGGPLPARLTDPVDAVVISHLHLDHLHAPSLRLLEAGTPVLVPRGGGRLLHRTGLEVHEIAVGDVVPVGDATVTVVPAVHVTSRWPGSPIRADTVGYVVRGEGTTYFAGDTSLFPGMADLGPSDVAVLPVGGWGPSRGAHHMDPRDAATSLSMLRAGVAIPIHYGTLWPRGMSRVRSRMFHDPGREFAGHASSSAPDVDVRVLAPGAATSVRLQPGRGGPAAAR
jgi:L-ascorbate metabolism protein UlaG (beta-lactamase superfamily)